MKQLFEQMRAEVSEGNMYRDLTYLVEEIGERLSGTEELHRCASYLEEQLRAAGPDVRIDHFPMYHSFPGEAELKMTAPIVWEIPARPVCHIASTPSEGIEGELIYLGSGGDADYDGVDVSGKLVLTDMNWTPGRPEKARIAWEKGAAGLIIMNWGASDSELIQMGAVKSQWGNPDPDTFRMIPQIAVASISRASGEQLIKYCAEGEVRIRLNACSTREWVEAWQPTAFIKGGKSNGQYVLVGSHIDAWGKSAICNAAGNALSLELARLLYRHREELKRDVVFAFWDGHEIAEGGGSSWHCDRYWRELTEGCVAYINIDNLAIRGTTEPGVESLPELREFLTAAVTEIWKREGIWHRAYKGGGDSSFFGVGVPYVSFATEYTEERLKELNYAFYSPWLHSDEDTVDKIDRSLYLRHMDYFLRILLGLLQAERIPYRLGAMAEDAANQYRTLLSDKKYGFRYLADLGDVMERYVELAHQLDRTEGGGEPLNRILLTWERNTTVFRSTAGRYGQDACCYLQTERPIPALERALKNLENYPEGSHQYNLWETSVLHEKNRVFDALYQSILFAETALAAIK